MITLIFILSFILIGLFCLTAMNSAARRLRVSQATKLMNDLGYQFFYNSFYKLFFTQHRYEGLLFSNTCTQNILRFVYAILSIILLSYVQLIHMTTDPLTMSTSLSISWPAGFALLLGLFLAFFFIGDYLPRLLGVKYPDLAIRIGAPVASIFMVLAFPVTYLFLKLSNVFSRTVYFDHLQEPAKEELIEMIHESKMNKQLDPHDKQLIESVMEFKDRIAREVMVPRIDLFSLPADMPIQEAATTILKEGYSRIPVYQDSLDNIIGVLMYKDVIAKYMEYINKGHDAKVLEAPIKTLMKGVLYTPETKKISHLLQEFKKKQVHLAIVVDEYGGTEGIVTIEDILEEIVGDIADEYDEAEAVFVPLPEGGWVIDGRMNVLDIEEQFGIVIPQSGDYDTIGGYIFHQTGTIPEKGFILKEKEFEVEVLRSDDRRVEKVCIKKISPQVEQQGTKGT